MSKFNNRIPPLVIMMVAIVTIFVMAKLMPQFNFPLPGNIIFSACFWLVGAGVMLAGVAAFKKAKTTVNPLSPDDASELVVQGIFTYTRNPMYVGMLCWVVATSLYSENWFGLPVCIGFVSYINRFQIIPEEQAMNRQFPQQWPKYQAEVRRWL